MPPKEKAGHGGRCEVACVQQQMHIIGIIVEGLRRRQCRRLAVATQIDAEYRKTPAQFGSYRLEEREIEPNRVQQHDMRAAALDLVMERLSNHVIVPAKRGRRADRQ